MNKEYYKQWLKTKGGQKYLINKREYDKNWRKENRNKCNNHLIQWRKKNPDKNNAIRQRERNKFQQKTDKIKLKSGCMICGYKKCSSALCFHHKSGVEKKFQISNGGHLPWKEVKKEMAKCLILCFNCHTEIHNKKKMRI